jgi:hypothetical protein
VTPHVYTAVTSTRLTQRQYVGWLDKLCHRVTSAELHETAKLANGEGTVGGWAKVTNLSESAFGWIWVNLPLGEFVMVWIWDNLLSVAFFEKYVRQKLTILTYLSSESDMFCWSHSKLLSRISLSSVQLEMIHFSLCISHEFYAFQNLCILLRFYAFQFYAFQRLFLCISASYFLCIPEMSHSMHFVYAFFEHFMHFIFV